MFDIAPSEFLLVAIVALVVIGPKDLPKAMRVLGYWVGRARGVGRQFRSGFDSMVREAELAEMEKKWAEENARIMQEHKADPDAEPPSPAEPASETAPPVVHDPASVGEAAAYVQYGDHHDDLFSRPITVEKPVVAAAPADAVPAADNKADS